MKTIYPCITTITKNNWRKQLHDIDKYKIKEVAVFLSAIGYKERQKLYHELKKTKIKYVPHLHVRHDMTNEEIELFYQNYKTRQFNTHGNYLLHLQKNFYLEKYFLIESTTYFDVKNAKKLGYCADIAHLLSTSWWLKPFKLKKQVDDLIKQDFLPKANHLSGLAKNGYDTHFIKKLEYYDYLKKAPPDYFGKIICLEVENSIREQLKFINYIQKII